MKNTIPVIKHQPPSDAWRRWRIILDRIIRHPQYRYDAPASVKNPLIKMAQFAMAQMGIFNTAYHAGHRRILP